MPCGQLTPVRPELSVPGGNLPRMAVITNRPKATDPEVAALFAGVDPARGQAVIAFGWAMVEDLARLL